VDAQVLERDALEVGGVQSPQPLERRWRRRPEAKPLQIGTDPTSRDHPPNLISREPTVHASLPIAVAKSSRGGTRGDYCRDSAHAGVHAGSAAASSAKPMTSLVAVVPVVIPPSNSFLFAPIVRTNGPDGPARTRRSGGA
jgi:hypothetical protein